AHPAVRKLSFTGGARTGREVVRSAAENFKTVVLELGGNDAANLLDDVVVDDQLAAALIEASLSTTGQICMAAKRIYVASSRFDEVVDAYTEAASHIVVGDGMDPSVTMGPLVNATQADRFDGIVRDALDRGGVVREVGSLAPGLDPEGHFRLPHIVTGLDPSAQLVRDEQFGPATPFIPFDDVDDAVAQANDTEFGLGGSVWSADVERARAVARRVEAGMVFINRHNVPAVHPLGIFGGVKQSGIGRELGRWGIESYTETCEIVDPAPPA
ncbi:MAG: aldehyde dehydrogenase family protein, partial [Acidimicrobiia bacterium]